MIFGFCIKKVLSHDLELYLDYLFQFNAIAVSRLIFEVCPRYDQRRIQNPIKRLR